MELYDITDSDVNIIDSDGMYTDVTESVETYEEIWNTYEEEYAQVRLDTRSTRGSNPPDETYNFITSPSDWESGYLYSSTYTTGQYHNYYTMGYFSSGYVCSPTAATNLCFYWYNKDSNRYGSLKYDGSWRSTFERLYMYMDTDADGTDREHIAWGLESYLDEVGPAFYVSLHYGTNNGLLLVDEIGNDRACILSMHDSIPYNSSHSVLAIGYVNYVYSDGNSTYIRIADGWTENANRYVWGASYGSWAYVKVIPQ